MNEDAHVGNIASALVMLAAVATTFTTFTFYKEEEVAVKYEQNGAALEQTANALVNLRLAEEALLAQMAAEEEKDEDSEEEASAQ